MFAKNVSINGKMIIYYITEKQHELISSMLKDFPGSSLGFAYEAYKKELTQKNASRFIDETLEHNADIIANKKNYIGYLANRPGAVKFGPHGLFSQTDEPINLNKVAKEVANHNGNVWTHIVSLRRDDAQKMGYDNLTAWRELVKRQIPNIAKQSKIDIANLKWYAAFHDKETNPHVHIVVYSTNEREGFLTKQGSEKIRSGFMNDIYTDELKHIVMTKLMICPKKPEISGLFCYQNLEKFTSIFIDDIGLF